MKKTFIQFIIGLGTLIGIAFIIGVVLTHEQNKCFDRLEVIQQRLQEINSEKNQLEMDITTKKQQIQELKDEEEQLNNEALDLFDNFISGQLQQQAQEDLSIAQQETVEQGERYPGKLTEDESHQEMPELTGNDSHERFKEMASKYGLDASVFWNVENHYGIKEGTILCITVAETSGGNRGYGKSNPGNVGNNDRGDRVTYAMFETGLEKIGQTLTNQYLGSKKTLGCLSNAGHCTETNDNGKRYATSNGNRERNMIACLSDIYGENIDPSTFSIRR